MNIKPLNNKLLVTEEVQEYNGPIFIPPSVRANRQHDASARVYRVLSAGPKAVDVRSGMRVLAHSYTNGPTKLPDGRRLIDEDMVLAIL